MTVKFHSNMTREKLAFSLLRLMINNDWKFDVIKKGTVDRLFRTLPIGLRPVYLIAKVQRLQCNDCGLIRQERLKYADEKKAIPIG